jgi:hypothetical protein
LTFRYVQFSRNNLSCFLSDFNILLQTNTIVNNFFKSVFLSRHLISQRIILYHVFGTNATAFRHLFFKQAEACSLSAKQEKGLPLAVANTIHKKPAA